MSCENINTKTKATSKNKSAKRKETNHNINAEDNNPINNDNTNRTQ